MSPFKTISHNDADGLEIARFMEMDNYAVEEYDLSIELMMENAGLQLATLISFLLEKSAIFQIGFLGNASDLYIKPNLVLNLAAAKKILKKIPSEATVYLADLGLPKVVYDKFGVIFPPFDNGTLLKIES